MSQLPQGRKDRWEVMREQGAPRGGQCFCVAGQRTGHVSDSELIPEDGREQSRAFGQESVRLKQALKNQLQLRYGKRTRRVRDP